MFPSTPSPRVRASSFLPVLFFLLTAPAGAPVLAEPPDPLPAALEVLKRFSGVWDTDTRIRQEGPPPREFRTRGKAVCTQTLEGRYFEFRTRSIPPGQSDLQIMTFDVLSATYRQWLFDSDGYRHEATGRWDAARSTLQWKGETAAGSFVIEDHGSSPDRLEWTLVRKDARGRKLQSIEGTLVRARETSFLLQPSATGGCLSGHV